MNTAGAGGTRGDEVVLGLDAGTSSAKAVAVDPAGNVQAVAGSDPISTRATTGGGSEQDPEEIWQALTTAGRRVVESLPVDVGVAALAVAAQSGSVIPVLDRGRAERAITWMDTRSRPLVESWSSDMAGRIRELSGWTPTAGVGLSTIAWLRSLGSGSHRDRHSTSAARWASVDDYLMFGLAGQWATNPSNASGMQIMDVSTRSWSNELCRFAGIDPAMLSPIRESGSVIGGLTAAAAAALGLDAGVPVVMGGHDQACAALGLGAADPGDLFLSAGTAWVLTVVTDRADIGALPPALNLSPHVVAGRWTASENLGGLGAMIAGSSPSEARHTFKTCAVRVRGALDRAGQMTAGGNELIMVGGGTRLEGLVEIIADTIGRSVVARPEASWPAVGAARLAAAASGWAPRRAAT